MVTPPFVQCVTDTLQSTPRFLNGWSNGYESYEVGDDDRLSWQFVSFLCLRSTSSTSTLVGDAHCFEYGSYYTTSAQAPAGSPSDVAAPAPAAEAAPAVAAPAGPSCDGTTGCATGPSCDGSNGCTTGCTTSCEDCKMECPDPCEPWRLFANHNDNCHGRVLRGWVNAGIMENADNPASRFNGPTTFYL